MPRITCFEYKQVGFVVVPSGEPIAFALIEQLNRQGVHQTTFK